MKTHVQGWEKSSHQMCVKEGENTISKLNIKYNINFIGKIQKMERDTKYWQHLLFWKLNTTTVGYQRRNENENSRQIKFNIQLLSHMIDYVRENSRAIAVSNPHSIRSATNSNDSVVRDSLLQLCIWLCWLLMFLTFVSLLYVWQLTL